MTLPFTFSEFRKNPIAAVTFAMLIVVGYLYYDSESTKQTILSKCERDNQRMQVRMESMERQIKRSDSLIAVYTYEIKFYLNAIEGYSETIQK